MPLCCDCMCYCYVDGKDWKCLAMLFLCMVEEWVVLACVRNAFEERASKRLLGGLKDSIPYRDHVEAVLLW